MKLLRTSIGRFRLVSLIEGISLVLLLFVAMPIKYGLGNEEFVSVIGAAHGGLFLLFCLMTFLVADQQDWNFGKTTWKVLLSSIIPFGTFYIDKKVLKPIYVAS